MPNIGKNVTIEVNNKAYTFSPFTIDILNEFVEYANSTLPDPLELVAKNFSKFPKEMQEVLVKTALEKAATRKEYASDEIQAVLNSIDGITKVMSLLLKKHHPQLTDSDTKQLLQDCIDEHGIQYLEKAFQKAHGTVEQEESEVEKEELENLGYLPIVKKKVDINRKVKS